MEKTLSGYYFSFGVDKARRKKKLDIFQEVLIIDIENCTLWLTNIGTVYDNIDIVLQNFQYCPTCTVKFRK